jgi:D-amino-acid dehydrogenase
MSKCVVSNARQCQERVGVGREVIVLGAGIVGLCCAHYLLRAGASVTLIDREPTGDKASIGNAGGIAVTEIIPASVPGLIWRIPGWLFDPLGPLSIRPQHVVRLTPWLVRFLRAGRAGRIDAIATAIAALNERAHDDWGDVLGEIGLSDDLHRVGALAVYETSAGFGRDRAEWDARRRMGIICTSISGDEARRMEPALGPLVTHAVWTPQWSHVSDPKRVALRLLTWVSRNSARVVQGVATRIEVADGSRCVVLMADGSSVCGDALVVATGAWSAQFCSQLDDLVSLESERGYNTTIAEPGIALGREIIFAERKFVATPLSCGLRIGGAAEFGGLTAPPNYERSKALVTSAKRYLPGLETTGGVEWMGHRPATPDSLPVISQSARSPNVYYAFGHGHLGLTQAATTGRLIAELISGLTPVIELDPYRIQRFAKRR